MAAGQAARTGWAKLIGDWSPDNDPLPPEVLAAVVAGRAGPAHPQRVPR